MSHQQGISPIADTSDVTAATNVPNGIPGSPLNQPFVVSAILFQKVIGTRAINHLQETLRSARETYPYLDFDWLEPPSPYVRVPDSQIQVFNECILLAGCPTIETAAKFFIEFGNIVVMRVFHCSKDWTIP